MTMPEFTVVLREDGNWDVFIDGERLYFDLNDMGLVDLARDFRDSNSDRLAPVDASE